MAYDSSSPESGQLGSRPWRAAAPYLVGAVAAWVAAVVLYVNALTAQIQQFQPGPDGQTPSMTKAGLLQSLSQVCVFAGGVLLAVGLFIVVLRQHEQWRRTLGVDLTAPLSGDGDEVVSASRLPADDPVPEYARSNWDDNPGDRRR